MLIRIKELHVLPDYCLQIRFEDGKEVIYDMKEDATMLPTYAPLLVEEGLFDSVTVDPSRTSIVWNKAIDLPSDILYDYGKPIAG